MKNFFCLLFLFFSTFSIAQQAEYVDFKIANIDITIDTISKQISGKAEYTFNILSNTKKIYLDAQNITFENVKLNGDLANVQNDGKKLWFISDFLKSKNNKFSFSFSANPKKALYFLGWDSEAPNQIWTQGQGKYTSNWLPSIDDVNDKIEFDLTIMFDKGYEVISNGKLVNNVVGEKTIKWSYDMQKPMSSYLVALAIGKYNKKVEYSKSGIPLKMYYYPEDSAKVEPTYRYTKQMFDFLEDEIGVPYPWQNYKQVPVHDFLYSGMENTSCTIFSDAYMIDEVGFVDKNYVNVNAHELAHQWFGNLVTAESGEHHWLQEGFATYYALLAEREVFGDDYYYWRLYEYAQELLEQDKAGNGTSLLNPKSSSTTFYKKGAWVLHMLREKVGEKDFKQAVESYLENHQFKNVETDDFISEVEKASGEDLSEFVGVWLKDKTFHYNKCIDILVKSSTLLKEKISLDRELMSSSHSLEYSINRYWEKAKNNKIKERFVLESKEDLGKEILKTAFQSKDIKLRQAISQSLTEIPSELKQDYETLLSDKSYITIESALYNLWNNFPEDRVEYLNQTIGTVGFNTKNVRLLWLVLALSTPEYQSEQSKEFYDELVDYTSSKYNFELRQNAFQYLLMLKSCKTDCQKNLEQATTHHNWRLSKFAKEQLKLINTN